MSRKLLVVLVVLALMALPMTAMAGRGGDYNKDVQISFNMDTTMQMMAYTNMAAEFYNVSVNVGVTGDLEIDSLVEAVAKNDQYPEKNFTFNYEADNNAKIEDSSLGNFTGNLGVNVAAGNSNAQSNIATYAAGDGDYSLTRATIFSVQKAMYNMTKNEGSANNATIAGSVLSGATGNVGVNVAAGNNNAQSNMTAISVAPAGVGMALAYVQQKSLDNLTCNGPTYTYEPTTLTGTFEMTGSVNFPDTPVGIYQQNNFYSDIWEGQNHPQGPVIGHADLDIEMQGAVANPWRQGVGGLAFEMVIPDAVLDATVTGSQDVLLPVLSAKTVNNATISANTLSNLTGNFGINVAAGNNNMQANAFAACYVPAVSNGGETPIPGNGGGEN